MLDVAIVPDSLLDTVHQVQHSETPDHLADHVLQGNSMVRCEHRRTLGQCVNNDDIHRNAQAYCSRSGIRREARNS